jgi:ATP-dependent DNA ligase
MSDELSNFVLENFTHAVKMPLGDWLLKNPLPNIVENKYDGIRVFLFKSGEKLVISSKRGELYTPKSSPKVFSTVPEFVHAPHQMILDGEYVAKKGGLFLFDVLQIDDRDVRPLPLTERKKILHEILRGNEVEVRWTLAKSVDQIMALMQKFVKRGEEGAIVKNPTSTYGQPSSWLKLKRFDTVDCFVTGIEETPEFKRSGTPHSWFIAVYDDAGRQVDIGKVGAFVERVKPSKVTVGSVVEVRFTMVTDDLKLRGPFILRVRHDKEPSECKLDQLKQQGR